MGIYRTIADKQQMPDVYINAMIAAVHSEIIKNEMNRSFISTVLIGARVKVIT